MPARWGGFFDARTTVGINLARSLSDIVYVTVAGTPCTAPAVVQPQEVMTCFTGPSAPTSGPVRMETLSSGETEEDGGLATYTYNVPPTTQSVEPPSGPEAGGITVVILGQSLGKSVEDIVDVRIGNASCLETLAYHNDSMLSCELPVYVGGPTTVRVVVDTVSGGSGNATGHAEFTYYATPTPIIASVQPASGSTSGYTIVRIQGQNFGLSAEDIIDITIANISCRFSLVYESPESISCFTGSSSG